MPRKFSKWTDPQWLLKPLAFITANSVLGYATFGLHPQWATVTEFSARIMAVAYSFFAQLQVLATAYVVFVALIRWAGWTWVSTFIWVFGIGWLSEHIGTGTGLPFGEYQYTDLLGWKLGGRVPILIPTSWFMIAVPAYVMADHRFRQDSFSWGRVFWSSSLVVSWDLVLDPAMSKLTPYWIWGEVGAYYGMPLLNLFGWFVTAFIIAVVMELVKSFRWTRTFSLRWSVILYFLTVAVPLGMCIAAGFWGATILSLLVFAGTFKVLGIPFSFTIDGKQGAPA
jgi:putative membrane protein